MSAPRVALAGMILESNRFAKPADQADFDSLTWAEGEALLDQAKSKTPALAAECAAFVRAMDATGRWSPCPLLLAASHPAGPVKRDVFERAVTIMEDRLRATGPVDAVYICNHGAMVAEHLHDPDGEIFARLRAAAGPDAIMVATLDLHANVSARMVDAADLIVGYRTNPHVDMIERGEEAAFSLRRIIASGRRPCVALCKPPIAPASVTLLTAEGPYGDLINYGQRRQAEMAAAILNVSIFGNFVFSDVPENGIAVVVTAREDAQAADTLAREIGELAWKMRERFTRRLRSVSDAAEMATATEDPPVLFSDAGDNPGGGGSGRTTELLEALIDARAEGVLYGSFHDPELANEAHELGIGARFTAHFNRTHGTDTWAQWDRPLMAEAEVVALGDGHVTGERGLFGGRRLTLGPTAALRIGGITVVVISDRSQTADPVFFHMLGLDISAARTVVVKSRGHFRAGFDLWFKPEQIHEIDTMGLTSPILERWPFQHLPRPSYPLDPDTNWNR
ncbi:M81 family metallopeptidase [Ovoidimarina sediminis]|uniref:M81 family metallopeptidase n=1 Tax=Ovoidimarina sediminis TaxID=3079856 RepID=UPI002912F721|nr:M81 family metallopeptidase [Rhodophyticola sp. MJ-SS7]MDU8942082.1 M81 family metallopeptidase [Rhodophyticola sp. MJ-SS7]